MSPTARSLKHLRKLGYEAEVVEKWIPGANIRRDFLGFIDIIAIKDDEVIGVQATSGDNVSKRVAKITVHEKLPIVRRVGWRVVVHGWSKRANGQYALREVDLS